MKMMGYDSQFNKGLRAGITHTVKLLASSWTAVVRYSVLLRAYLFSIPGLSSAHPHIQRVPRISQQLGTQPSLPTFIWCGR